MVAGRWTGTMCLTEPQSGSDLSHIRTRAIPDGNGAFKLSGQKIFITYGEHEVSENILHMVLARLPDAPEGSAGISLFAVPRILPDGSRNAVSCVSIEHKLGIHASPTCTMAFEDAAWLRRADERAAEARASAFLQLLGTATAGWLCARVAARADAPPSLSSAAEVFLSQILPRTAWHARALASPVAALTDTVPVA